MLLRNVDFRVSFLHLHSIYIYCLINVSLGCRRASEGGTGDGLHVSFSFPAEESTPIFPVLFNQLITPVDISLKLVSAYISFLWYNSQLINQNTCANVLLPILKQE